MKRDPVVEIEPRSDGEWGYHLKGGNGEIVDHGEGYRRRSGAVRAAQRAKDLWARAQLVVVERDGRRTPVAS